MAHGLIKSLRGTAFINGSWVDAHDGSTFEVTNPADETVIAEVANCGQEETPAIGPQHKWNYHANRAMVATPARLELVFGKCILGMVCT